MKIYEPKHVQLELEVPAHSGIRSDICYLLCSEGYEFYDLKQSKDKTKMTLIFISTSVFLDKAEIHDHVARLHKTIPQIKRAHSVRKVIKVAR